MYATDEVAAWRIVRRSPGIYADVSRRHRAALSAIGGACSADGPLEPYLNTVAASVAETLSVDCVGLYERRASAGFLLLAGAGWQPGIIGAATLEDDANSLIGSALRSDGPVVVRNHAGDQRFRPHPVLQQHGLISGIGIAVPVGLVNWGVIGAHARVERDFDDADLDFLRSVRSEVSRKLGAADAPGIEHGSPPPATVLDLVCHDGEPVPTWEIAWANAPGERLLGAAEGERVTGTELLSRIHPAHRADVARRLETLLAEGVRREHLPLRLVLADGSVRHLELAVVPVDEAGLAAWHVEALDVTDRVRAVQALHESEERFRLAIGCVRDYAIALLDTEGHIVSWNEGAERLLQHRPCEIEGRCVSLLWSPADVRARLPTHLLDAARGAGRVEHEGDLVRRDGSAFPANLVLNAVRDASGALSGFVAVIRDLTAQRKAEEANLRRVELERAIKELEQFAYVASHDLREPLRTMTAFVQLLARRYGDRLDDRAREYIGYTVEGATRMNELLDGLLEYSRVDTQREPHGPTPLSEVLDEALHDLGALLAESGATVTRDPLPVVHGDRRQLRQVLQNLVSNAVKFRRDEPPRVHLGAVQGDSTWRFTVSDNGIGIPADQQSMVFGIFKRLHPRDVFPGSGLGLSICKRIVESHGGQMGVESMPGVGSTFWFEIGHGVVATGG